MRKFFSFGSSTSVSGTIGNDRKLSKREKVRDKSQSPKDKVSEPSKHFQESKDSSNINHRRSFSYSYPAIYCAPVEGNLNSLNDQSVLPYSCEDSPNDKAESSLNCRSMTPERYTRSKQVEQASVRRMHMAEKLDSPNSSRGYQCSSGNSPYSSPIPLRCRSARLTDISSKNKILDLYIDGEHQEIRSKKDNMKQSSSIGTDGCLAENRALPHLGRPPRAQSTAPSSPTCSKENLRSYSFREVKDIKSRSSMQDWIRDEHRLIFPPKYKKKDVDRQSYTGSGISARLQDYDTETTITVEDIYEDSSEPQPSLHSNGMAPKFSSGLAPYIENLSGSDSCTEEPLSFQWQSYLPGNGCTGNKKSVNPGLSEENDEELLKKAREAEDRLAVLSEEECELDELQSSSLNLSSLLQKIKHIKEDRRCLTFELSSQINHRIAERSSMRESLKQAKVQLDTRTRRLEKEKSELQLSLEKELDRRSSEWSLKLEKFKSEEQRLRERARELAEQNVSLQREISSFKGNEAETRNKFMNSQIQLNSLTTNLEEMRTEKNNLHQAFSELHGRFNAAAEDLDCVRRSYKEKEKECKDLQKLVVQLQKTCCEQDKTINGLRQGYSDEIGKQPIERGDNISRLQMEQLRLIGVEQMLRRELDSCRQELESLRHENICLLDRLQGSVNSYGFFSVKLDQELHARIDCLQTQGLSLLGDNVRLSGELLGFIKQNHSKRGQDTSGEFDEYSVVEYTMKHQSLRRGIENFRRTLHRISEVLQEKSSLESSECQSQTTGGGTSRQLGDQDELELELKAETILTRLLREKVFSKELELEQLEASFASSLRSHDVLQTEIQRLQDELSCLNHKTKDIELQILRKDEANNQLQHEIQECMKELTSTRGVLLKVSEERDRLWEEVKHSRETIMLLEHEASSLKKKIEALDEDVLIKEGQITILKDSLGDKPFDVIYPSNAVKEFTLE